MSSSLIKRLLFPGIATVLCLLGLWYYLTPTMRHPHTAVTITPTRAQEVSPLIPVVIIGSGPAGLSAALYTARFNLHTVVFEGKKPGGQLMSTTDVENWPGLGRILGPQIIEKLRLQATQFGANIHYGTVEKFDGSQWPYALTLDDGSTAYALTVIIATGASPVKLGVPGEQEYWGKGVTSCAVCDAPFFKGKTVVVAGGGDAAVEECLQLAALAKHITLLVRGPKMRASHTMQQRLKAYSKITIRFETSITEIKGNGSQVTGVTLTSKGIAEEFATDGVFLAIGHTPNSALFKDWVACDEKQYIKRLDHQQNTSLPGVFSAGDVSDHFYRQAGIASGDGIKAAIDAATFLRNNGFDEIHLAAYESSFFAPTNEEQMAEIPEIKTLAAFEALLEREKKPLIVDFYTQTCPSCKQVIKHLKAVVGTYQSHIAIVKVDSDVIPELSTRYDITSLPTVLAFKKGLVIGRSSSSLTTRKEVQTFISQFAE